MKQNSAIAVRDLVAPENGDVHAGEKTQCAAGEYWPDSRCAASAHVASDRSSAIRCLIPDLPDASSLMPLLSRIDENRWYTNSGPLALEFEQRLLGFIDGASGATCVTVSSGMSALELGLRALGIGDGKRVLLPALTFPATALAVTRCGAVPVLGDVCPRTWTLTPSIARSALDREQIDLVMPVAAFGLALPNAEWDEFVAQTGVPVLADAAAALGTQPLGKRTHWAFSLHATKPMGIGEGGLFVSFDETLTERVRRLANFGFEHKMVHLEGGTNAKLSEYAAAIGLVQLNRWSHLNARRQTLLEEYRRQLAALRDVRLQWGLTAPPATLCVRLPTDAMVVADGLAQDGIETRRWYLPPLYEHPAFARMLRIGPNGGSTLPVTESLATLLLGLPFHTRLSAQDVARVVESLGRHLKGEATRQ